MDSMRVLRMGFGAVLCLSAIACGGGGGSTAGSGRSGGGGSSGTTSNVASVIVDEGPSNASVNTLFTSVTICAPRSTTNCQTIDHVQVDTGSYGLRILAPVLSVSLPIETLSNGNTVAECTQFVDGFAWGPIETADVQIAGETANSLPIQVIGAASYSNVPSDCSSTGPSEDTVATFGANGILGVGPFELDQPGCVAATPACYYACTTATSCTNSAVPSTAIVANPVTLFAVNNNGVIIVLPSVPPAGALTVTGSLIFGIDTQSNNQSGTQTVLTVDDNAELAVMFNGNTLAKSFIDSGSNGIYFSDPSIAPCTNTNLKDFYCPANTVSLGLSMEGLNGVMANNLTFDVGNAQSMISANQNFNAFPLLAGTNPNMASFDYGLAFFYGKRVSVAVEGNKTSVGTGPYIAF